MHYIENKSSVSSLEMWLEEKEYPKLCSVLNYLFLLASIILVSYFFLYLAASTLYFFFLFFFFFTIFAYEHGFRTLAVPRSSPCWSWVGTGSFSPPCSLASNQDLARLQYFVNDGCIDFAMNSLLCELDNQPDLWTFFFFF